MIKEISIISKYKSLSPFKWSNVPKFAVICGINGSGKTQFFEAIFNLSRQATLKDHFTSIAVVQPIHGKVQYVPANHQFGNLNNNTGTTNQVESRVTSIVQYAKTPKHNRSNSQLNAILKLIEEKSGRLVDELTSEEIQTNVPANYMWYLDNGFNNQYISELFKAYTTKFDSIRLDYIDQNKTISQEETYKKIGFPPPWIIINEIFDKYDFNYHIKIPNRGMHYVPSFIDKHEKVNEIEFDNLSSGEKIIVSLILWAFNQKIGEKNSIFLLDEFDAHLNPSMSKMFIEIVKDKLVGEYGLQVIMSTHSPSTVAFVDDEDIFWMERGKELRKRSKSEIINILSDGVMTFNEGSILLLELIKSKSELIIFTEGESDIIHLKNSSSKIDSQINFDAFSCNGANKLKQFLIGCPDGIFGTKKIVGLFDYDTEGLNCIQSIIKESNFSKVAENIYKSKSNSNVYAVMLPVPSVEFIKYKYCPIEHLYEKNILNGYELLEKRNLKEINNINESTSQLSSTEYDSMDSLWFYRITEIKTSKAKFANHAGSLDKAEFKNFIPLFELFKTIMK